MKITLLVVGKTEDKYLIEGIEKYLSRLKHYIGFTLLVIPELKNTKNLTEQQQKSKEAELILKQISNPDVIILMDEKGKKYSSVQFAQYLNKQMIGSVQQLTFVIGGPYGFDESVYQRANGLISLSDMTFSHQMVRLFFVEQLYRAFSILKGEPYHHQ
ncbi:23S rRNA (pseudouridine(1915)-N(3))-methyltransferase RlmH [Pedobacter antarcticus]|uniref:Ribosomal RNA large subunit methyltransferase H n=2 Tax=Pedobacter antarcticus TaxID=34086 RepID=A0A081PGZ0_9SPHI|nr:23S rRNA (pseudouridine(1915)-N(3))-methyltransferase RlmH [Pedobacter antarcticus]KEQ29963.1 50S rRNA methyltransferase [Pedobacter antarcticus 4BY]SDM04257.1 23S rRNA (pseudouridine1915-N3)-methyltransferase [Pedobacter antarcticus]SFF28406.1 23S rRNA (pseudouridine1915-N3)-methyltransferase [Pedobacter antarcticus]